ncbi:glucose-1-phosphate thymidylyltransferase [Taibaiella sp. KBW10]|uniref:sugar phosphate nucleotidyltransferase n=1 Tax=Taibaiella sp. KBW10 TaxID=2153357 RepID=UPI000F5AE1FA|nr:sugar phosphate nucleotidyltransferase [Taibaiella sp. KBW10]RQO30522.1 glucose-1-phosphate thymidylyltransferase [Taibaiella sp. KBW10]
MKAIIPLAGAGTKLRPHTYTQPKALIPIAGKTILSVLVEQLLENGINEFVFVIGYLGDKIQDYINKTYPDLKCHFVTQNDRKGTGHAIWLTKDIVNDDEIFILYGDTICDYNIQEVINSPHSEIGVRRVDDPRYFGVAEIGDNRTVFKLIEKPMIPKSNMALVGIFKIKETQALYKTLDYCIENNIGSIDGEYHLTEALQLMIDDGGVFKAFKVNNWFDCGKKDTLLETNATLLKGLKNNSINNDRFANTVILPPVSIAEGCKIENSIIGPNATIGEHSTITSSIVSNSIIGSFAVLEEVVLKSSIIGSDAFVRGMSQSLNIGDNTDIDFGK